MRVIAPLWSLIAVAVVVLDQATKALAEAFLVHHQPLPLLPMLNLTLSYNPGAAFSLLGGAGGWQRWLFAGFAVAVSVFLVVWLRRLPPGERWQTWGLSLILGGAVGNLVDRLVHGEVIDFIHVYWRDWHYPVFNVADSAITIGVSVVLVYTFFIEGRRQGGSQGGS